MKDYACGDAAILLWSSIQEPREAISAMLQRTAAVWSAGLCRRRADGLGALLFHPRALYCVEFPGESVALLESAEFSRVRLSRYPMDPYISYFVKE